MGHLIHNVDISELLTHMTQYTLHAIFPVQWKPGYRRHRRWAFAHSSQLPRLTAVRSRPRWRQRACRWAPLRRFLTVWKEILWLCKLIVASAVRMAGQGSCRQRCGGPGLGLWGLLDVLPDSQKRLWRQLIVEKLTLVSQVTALVNIPAVSMPIAHCNIYGIVLCDKSVHFRVALGTPLPYSCCLNSILICHVRWMEYLGKGEMLSNTDLDTFVDTIWKK